MIVGTFARRTSAGLPNAPTMDGPAELPRVEVSTTFPTVTGTTYNCPDLATYNTNIALAVGGDEIVLTGSFTGPINLPNRGDSGWVLIRSDNAAWASNSETRVSANTNMRTVTAGSSPLRAITTSTTAHHYYICGIEFKFPTGPSGLNTTLCAIGTGSETLVSQLPHHIIFDRCYIHGDATNGGVRGIGLQAYETAVINSYMFDFFWVDQDTQTIATWNSPGPMLIENNYLSADSENFSTGGSYPTITDQVLSDLVIRKNHIKKDLTKLGSYLEKNGWESKNAQRVLIERNVIENVWLDAQTGYAFNIKAVDQSQPSPANQGWEQCADFVFRDNKLVNVANGWTISGISDQPAGQAQRIRIRNNVAEIKVVTAGDYGQLFLLNAGPWDVSIVHNTILHIGSLGTAAYLCVLDNTSDAERLEIKDNVFSRGTYGIKAGGTTEGTNSLVYATGYSVTSNVIIGITVGNYPAGNFGPATSGDVGFVDYANGDYTLTGGGQYAAGGANDASDGTDMGADIATVEAYAAAAISGA